MDTTLSADYQERMPAIALKKHKPDNIKDVEYLP